MKRLDLMLKSEAKESHFMLQTLLSSLKASTSNDKQMTKRAHPRRIVDCCVVLIHGRTFPVENWSLGGILLQTDERLFGKEQDIDFTVKFKLHDNVIEISHKGTVVRKSNGKVAIKFEPLSRTIGRQFQKVIDDYVAGEFANSQA